MVRKRNSANGDDDARQERVEQLSERLSGLGVLGPQPDPAHEKRLREVMGSLPENLAEAITGRLSAIWDQEFTSFEEFCEKHGISPAEERLLRSLVDGHTIVEHAQTAGISVNTARTQMRSLLEKSGSSGQLDLIRKVHAPRT